MLKADALGAIEREWLALQREERRTPEQVSTFALNVKGRYDFKTSGDQYQVNKGRLLRRV